jgi:hypothetical protein
MITHEMKSYLYLTNNKGSAASLKHEMGNMNDTNRFSHPYISFLLAAMFVAGALLLTALPAHAGDNLQLPAIPAPVEVTGQTECWDGSGNPIPCEGTGQDGELQKGVAWPKPRFTVNPDGTVTDNLTGLIWLRNANCFGRQPWIVALSVANNLEDGQCGLTDGSEVGEWRLPNIKELQSLLNYGKVSPALPSDHPFSNVQLLDYWSSTNFVGNPANALIIFTDVGSVFDIPKAGSRFVWPVRGEQVDTRTDIASDNNQKFTNLRGHRRGCAARAPVEVTGQSECWDGSGNPIPCEGTGQDGELQKGVSWPTPRFTVNVDDNDVPDGTVTDNLTGLIWLQNADCFGPQPSWTDALSAANNLQGDGQQCGLMDGSKLGDWRLPNIKELQSLIDYGQVGPALPSGHPFSNVQLFGYWSSTSFDANTGSILLMLLNAGLVFDVTKSDFFSSVWPVRGGVSGLPRRIHRQSVR